jgi:hypothetical protein
MIIKFVTVYMVCISFLLPFHIAKAVEPLSIAELTAHCSHYKKDSSDADAVFCIRYIQGFIDGAIAIDERVVMNVIAKSNDKETFAERAMRTRKARSKSANLAFYAEFCLGTPIPLKSVVEKIITNFNKRKHSSKEELARDAVYFILRNEYPCTKETTK